MRTSLLALTLLVLLGSCASIVSKSNWPFTVDSTPVGATVTITNRSGHQIYQGKTPATVKLRSSSGFFERESYVITLALDGYETKKVNVECKLNGWYFGNIVFGGVIGMLIVDPATGAMYRLDGEGISETLTRHMETGSLNILDKNKIPANLQSHLVQIN